MDQASLPPLSIEQLSREFVRNWSGPSPSRIEQFLSSADPAQKAAVLRRLLDMELEQCKRAGLAPARETYFAHFPEFAGEIEAAFEGLSTTAVDDPTRSLEGTAASAAGATDTWRPGQTAAVRSELPAPAIAGYEILQLLGRGGMGFVLKARDLKLHRIVALKLPLPERIREESDRERFLREARAAARLRHPNSSRLGHSSLLAWLGRALAGVAAAGPVW